MSAFLGLQERLQERIRVESELREEKNRLLDVIKDKEGELSKERSELTSRLQEHEQVVEVNWENVSVFINIFYQGPKGGRGGGSLEPWYPEIFVVELRAQNLSRLGARTKIMFLAKWSPGVKLWSPRAPNFPSWSAGALRFLGRRPGVLNLFGTLFYRFCVDER